MRNAFKNDIARKEYLHNYYLKNKEKAAVKNKEWREANKDLKKESDKAYYENNKEKVAKNKHDWYVRNKHIFAEHRR